MRISDRLKEEVKARREDWQIQKNANKKNVLHGEGGTVTLRPKEWVTHGAAEYEETFSRLPKNAYKGNVREEKMYSLTSQAKDWFLELQLRSDKYTFKNMLAVIDPFDEAPLTALVMFSTITDYRVRTTVFGDVEETNFVYEFPEGKRHRIPILGLYAGRGTKVQIELLDEQEEVCDTRTFMLQTGELPEDLKDVVKAEKIKKNRPFRIFWWRAASTSVHAFLTAREKSVIISAENRKDMEFFRFPKDVFFLWNRIFLRLPLPIRIRSKCMIWIIWGEWDARIL